ncbi:hypothetical protein KHQ84_gp031 [Rhodococcus phage Finch]|uniref:Uncharacterized protein n=1 Tax=Rhodococcus phage Finch TaxID=2094144 RepID=A0A2P1JXD6_9CAUD|nr:hypothetical protein KHQ84_gp031 [Rhodococcus phage Finch]AVO24972.1 hypothetical protein SEA_FINCH_31 [Rhodococcus phage Finch]
MNGGTVPVGDENGKLTEPRFPPRLSIQEIDPDPGYVELFEQALN